jgi:hypothetical protein
MKGPVKSPAKIRLCYLTRQLDQLGSREMLLQCSEQFAADDSRSACHGNGKIKDELLNRAEDIAFPVVREVSQLFLGDAGCSALGRA